MSMVKDSFRERRKGYTDKAIVIRFFLFLNILLYDSVKVHNLECGILYMWDAYMLLC